MTDLVNPNQYWSRLKINNVYIEEFKVEFGIKQGYTLFTALVSVDVDVILKKLVLRRNISIGLKQCSAHADDIREMWELYCSVSSLVMCGEIER